jgi:hypothetical protein
MFLIDMPSLNYHKENLRQLRDSLKPIDHQELLDFEKEYLEKRRMMQLQKLKEREEKQKRMNINHSHHLKHPISSKWVEIKEREIDEKKHQEIKEKEVIQLSQKRRDYADLIKKTHWPEISKKKQLEIIERKMKLDSKSTRNSSKPLTSRKSESITGGSVVCIRYHNSSNCYT